ncbi:hypothetical protein QBC35DRAFT_509257 [Podospora australis]|uniref:Zn(2)-C6 fungal-type domain-containing protein n=1 Tax=Podospora australis TaxID=1536484 RepID=A0AAN7AEF4_9PEZI|nr:hypothetical protein QBC35DRAFT_509257 [Podospora australis]
MNNSVPNMASNTGKTRTPLTNARQVRIKVVNRNTPSSPAGPSNTTSSYPAANSATSSTAAVPSTASSSSAASSVGLSKVTSSTRAESRSTKAANAFDAKVKGEEGEVARQKCEACETSKTECRISKSNGSGASPSSSCGACVKKKTSCSFLYLTDAAKIEKTGNRAPNPCDRCTKKNLVCMTLATLKRAGGACGQCLGAKERKGCTLFIYSSPRSSSAVPSSSPPVAGKKRPASESPPEPKAKRAKTSNGKSKSPSHSLPVRSSMLTGVSAVIQSLTLREADQQTPATSDNEANDGRPSSSATVSSATVTATLPAAPSDAVDQKANNERPPSLSIENLNSQISELQDKIASTETELAQLWNQLADATSSKNALEAEDSSLKTAASATVDLSRYTPLERVAAEVLLLLNRS